ncbi:TPA: hypothetical protein ACPWZ0_002645 [Salmonella enterica subsp. enterica serovar Vietnam]|uniref:Lipoprotein n=1 Tax=Salmonella enterica subsp. arizonae TaxID=59203 RepID=A0A5Y2QJ97_SALER|nr:hypothetical protein [Salmonella enterica]ECF4921707.1 hypothetical protein [Salmonella enterica subsp. arizonae]ECI9860513.1 hypothetical protein [Salmonella enterica subsp. arizonae]HAE8196880.1 hypothetical protein [Salmonella enterica subsp. indica serovar 41:b:1,7]HAU3217989.1 hypothetical protein [Salmonella enterica subsp. indica]
MNFRTTGFVCATTLFLLAGCSSHSSIDARKTGASHTAGSGISNNPSALTDKDIFGNETTLAVSEEDIQAALEGEPFRVPMNSPVILVQSGSRAPEAIIQQEMNKYYTVSTFSGIPDRQKVVTCNKNKDAKNSNDEAPPVENMNYMQALRYIAAKGHQKAIIVYQGTLQSGKYDSALKSTVWSDYKNEKLKDNVSMRYLVRFTLVDVATGEWATWSPVNYEYKVLPPVTGTGTGKKETSTTTTDVTEQQITRLKQKTYAAVVKDLVNRYQ